MCLLQPLRASRLPALALMNAVYRIHNRDAAVAHLRIAIVQISATVPGE